MKYYAWWLTSRGNNDFASYNLKTTILISFEYYFTEVMKINRRACTLQSIIILRYLHSCGKKTKLRQGCTPWYNMLDIHGFNPNSTKSSNVFFRDRHFDLRHVNKLGLEGTLGTTTSQQSEERLLDTVFGIFMALSHGVYTCLLYTSDAADE